MQNDNKNNQIQSTKLKLGNKKSSQILFFRISFIFYFCGISCPQHCRLNSFSKGVGGGGNVRIDKSGSEIYPRDYLRRSAITGWRAEWQLLVKRLISPTWNNILQACNDITVFNPQFNDAVDVILVDQYVFNFLLIGNVTLLRIQPPSAYEKILGFTKSSDNRKRSSGCHKLHVRNLN